MKAILTLLCLFVLSANAQWAASYGDGPFLNASIPMAASGGDFTTGLVLDLDADSLSGADGSAISTWTDTIASLVFTGDSGVRPYFTNSVSVLNNHKAAVFISASSEYMYNSTLTASAGNFTIIAILVPFDGANSTTEDIFSTSSANNFTIGSNSGNNSVGFYDGSWHDSAANTTGGQCLSWVMNSTGTAGAIYRNGSQLGSSSAYIQQALANQTTIGSYHNGGIQFFNGMIARLKIYNSALSDPNRTTAENFLRTKYGL